MSIKNSIYSLTTGDTQCDSRYGSQKDCRGQASKPWAGSFWATISILHPPSSSLLCSHYSVDREKAKFTLQCGLCFPSAGQEGISSCTELQPFWWLITLWFYKPQFTPKVMERGVLPTANSILVGWVTLCLLVPSCWVSTELELVQLCMLPVCVSICASVLFRLIFRIEPGFLLSCSLSLGGTGLSLQDSKDHQWSLLLCLHPPMAHRKIKLLPQTPPYFFFHNIPALDPQSHFLQSNQPFIPPF